jgi:putative ABC transport system permease protein
LQGANHVVIADHIAKKLFGDQPALGKIIQLGDDRRSIEISGVTEKQPENAHFHFNYLISMPTNPNVRKNEGNWFWTQVVTYVRLVPGADRPALEDKMVSIGENVIKPSYQSFGVNYDDFMSGRGQMEFYLRPIRDIHLKSGDNRLGATGDVRYAYAFGAIGIFVLIIAAINFVNLSTARGTKRAREVGVKKALGALRNSLISQFQSESIFLALFSMVLAIPLVELLRLVIVSMMKDDLPFTLWGNPAFLIALPAVTIVVGFLAGLYPSFYLTSFLPAQVLKGKVASGMGNSALRGTLVVVQFTISIALLIGTVVVVQQMEFIRTTNLGFDKENVLVINHAEKLGEHIKGFRDELKNIQGIVNASISQDVPRNIGYQSVYMAEGSDAKLACSGLKIDENFVSAFGLQFVAGRAPDPEHNASDKMAVIVNETFVKLFGWTPETAIGKNMIHPDEDSVRSPIIGVVKNFHFQSLRENIHPLFMSSIDSKTWGNMRVVAVKYKTDDLPDLIRSIERKWNSVVDQTPMDFSFLDDDIARSYEEDQRLGDLFAIFATLSIIIAMIGLIGLVAYSAEVRKKEIGIRKVLGATRSRIVVMMNSNYLKLIIVGLLISTPLSWYAMNYWLESFKYKIEISPLVFVFSGVAVMVAALISVAYLSLRAASVNPASVLKEE